MGTQSLLNDRWIAYFLAIALLFVLITKANVVGITAAAYPYHEVIAENGRINYLPENGQTIWAQAGYDGDIPDIFLNIIDVKKHGATGDGITDDYDVIQSAIDNAPNPSVIFFPAGTYMIKSQLILKSGIVLRGEGYKSTHLNLDGENGCIKIIGSTSDIVATIQSGLEKGSSQITVSDASIFTVDQGAELSQENVVEPIFQGWVEPRPIGQMVKILAIDNNILTIAPPLNRTFNNDKNLTIMPVNFIKEAGVEDLHIKRIHSDDAETNNVYIERAANCWIRRVESDYTLKYHFSIVESLNIEIRDSYIHDSKSKGDGGQGYGVYLAKYDTAILVENNIFRELRHSMIMRIGVNGCIFGYNYSEKNYSDDGWDKAGLSLRGHYSYMNLFEGNIVNIAGIGVYWGPDGPGNTIFRNRVMGTDKGQGFGDYRGILLRHFDGDQNIIGNEILGKDGIYFTSDTNSDWSHVVNHGNNVRGDITWDPAFDQNIPASLYLSSKPDFFEDIDWPPIGPEKTIGQGTIPALDRWQQGNYIPARFQMDLPEGWSMISLPLTPYNKKYSVLFPEAVVLYGYEKEVGYVSVMDEGELEIGRGYWIFLEQNQNYLLTGQPIQSYNLSVNGDGWAMIGGCTSRAKALSDNSSIVVIYGYVQEMGYRRIPESEIEPGKGYWILFKNVKDNAELEVKTTGQCP